MSFDSEIFICQPFSNTSTDRVRQELPKKETKHILQISIITTVISLFLISIIILIYVLINRQYCNNNINFTTPLPTKTSTTSTTDAFLPIGKYLNIYLYLI